MFYSYLGIDSYLKRSRVKVSQQEIEKRMTHFKEVCLEMAVKLTFQRMEVFREVAQNSDHPDAETVYRNVHQRIPTISMDTVYRTLWLLRDIGLVTTLGAPRGRTRFDANLDRHHHFVCVLCGSTHDFYSKDLDELNISKYIKDLGQVETTQIQAQGVCLECAGNKQ